MVTWDEVLQWTYITPDNKEFIPFIKGGYLHYYFVDDPEDIVKWMVPTKGNTSLVTQYKRGNINPHSTHLTFVGPLPLPPSPVILKIRQMEKHFNERKNKPIIDNSW